MSNHAQLTKIDTTANQASGHGISYSSGKIFHIKEAFKMTVLHRKSTGHFYLGGDTLTVVHCLCCIC